MQNIKLKLLVPLFVLTFGGILLALYNASFSAAITIQVTPLSSTVMLDKKVVKPGVIKVKPGAYTVSVVKDGFATKIEKFTVGKSENKYVGVGLVSNSDETKDWYKNHPEDAKILEGISSKQFDIRSQNLIKKQPFLKLLPFTAAGLEYKIDYGVSQNPNTADLQAIYITANSPQAQQDALIWIRGQGYDPATMEIIYQPSAAVGQPTNNSSTAL